MTSVYLDASVLVSLFISDRHSPRAENFLASSAPWLIVSDFAAAEFASALSRRVRIGDVLPDQAGSVFLSFDSWIARETQQVEMNALDVKQAKSILRRLDMPLRTPDALNIVVAERVGAALATFDAKMAECARRLGITAVEL